MASPIRGPDACKIACYRFCYSNDWSDTQTFILNIFFFKYYLLMYKTLMRKNTDWTFKKTNRIILDFMGYFL